MEFLVTQLAVINLCNCPSQTKGVQKNIEITAAMTVLQFRH